MIKEKVEQSFRYALKGLRVAWKEELNFKIEILVGLLAFILGIFLSLPAWQLAIIVLTICVVLTTEALNTALEELCDKFQPSQDPHVAKIKDLAAGAVLTVSAGAIAVGALIFIPFLLPFIIRLDNQIESWVLAIQTNFWLTIFSLITLLGSVYITALAGVVAILNSFWRSRFRPVLGFIVTLAGSALTAQIIKYLVNRVRPGIGPFNEELSLSFPSGHSTAAMALYGFLIYLLLKNCRNKKQRLAVWIIGVVLILSVGFSRLYIGAHFFSDILAGYLIGALWIAIGIFVSKKKV